MRSRAHHVPSLISLMIVTTALLLVVAVPTLRPGKSSSVLGPGIGSSPLRAGSAVSSSPNSSSPKQTASAALQALPLFFHENDGSHPEQVRFHTYGNGKALFFTDSGITYSLQGTPVPTGDGRTTDRWAVRLEFENTSSNAELRGRKKTTARTHRFVGPESDWQTDTGVFEGLIYKRLWEGIDLLYGGHIDHFKHKLILAPGADPDAARFTFRGADDVSLASEGMFAGGLRVSTPVETFHDVAPVAFQEIDGDRRPVDVSYRILAANRDQRTFTYGFEVGDYDRTIPLVIDPITYVSCGFIGGIDEDEAFGVTVDHEGYFYVVGTTASDQATFPETLGPDLTHNGGKSDVFVARLEPDGTSLVFCTFLGGFQTDRGYGIAVDNVGDVYVTGQTGSQDFPIVLPMDSSYDNDHDAFITKLARDGSRILYSTYLGGRGDDLAKAIVVDGAHNVYVAGRTTSWWGWPTSYGPIWNSGQRGSTDAFVTRLNAAGNTVAFTHFVGGHGIDDAWGIDLDQAGNIYIVGSTTSDQASFPVTVGPSLSYGFGTDAYIAKIPASGRNPLRYCGYIGGTEFDAGKGVAVDSMGQAHVVGVTFSSQTFPVLVGPDLTYNGSGDAFIARVHPNGINLLYSGYIGGVRYDEGNAVAVDREHLAYVAGSTRSDEATFPVVDGTDDTFNGERDGFVSAVWQDGSYLIHSGYVGGAASDRLDAIDLDGWGSIYIAGTTLSSEATFPVRNGPDLTYNGTKDAIAGRLLRRPPLEWTCREGTVDLGRSATAASVLFVNNTAGEGVERVVSIGVNSPLEVTVQAPPVGPAMANFALYAYLGVEPSAATVTVQPHDLGDFCMPTLLVAGLPKPHVIWNNIGYRMSLGEPDYPSNPAPTTLVNRAQGVSKPLTLTLQGFIYDNASAARGPVSITNAVVVRVE